MKVNDRLFLCTKCDWFAVGKGATCQPLMRDHIKRTKHQVIMMISDDDLHDGIRIAIEHLRNSAMAASPGNAYEEEVEEEEVEE